MRHSRGGRFLLRAPTAQRPAVFPPVSMLNSRLSMPKSTQLTGRLRPSWTQSRLFASGANAAWGHRPVTTIARIIAFALAVAVFSAVPLCSATAEEPVDLEHDLPSLLDMGFAGRGPGSLTKAKREYERLSQHTDGHASLDRALALILAHDSRFGEMRRVLDESVQRWPHDLDLIRLHAWSQLSDRKIVDGLETTVTLVETLSRTTGNRIGALGDEPASGGPDRYAAVEFRVATFAGGAFGFASVVAEEVEPGASGRVEELRTSVRGTLGSSAVSVFDATEDRVNVAAASAIGSTKATRAANARRVAEEKVNAGASLDAEQKKLEEEAAARKAQAAELQQAARAALQELESQAAPYFNELNRLDAELGSLLAAQSAEKERVDKASYEPNIASVRGQIASVRSDLAPIVSQYQQVDQQAVVALRALGVRVAGLGKMHGANRARLRQNERRSESGRDAKVTTDLRTKTRLATYLPLNFGRERDLLLGSDGETPVGLD